MQALDLRGCPIIRYFAKSDACFSIQRPVRASFCCDFELWGSLLSPGFGDFRRIKLVCGWALESTKSS